MVFISSAFEDWKFKGHWWNVNQTVLPEQDRGIVAGELHYKGYGEGALLTTIGNINNLNDEFNDDVTWVHTILFDIEVPAWLHGVTTNGMPITLVDVIYFGGRSNSRSVFASEDRLKPRIVVTDLHVLPDTLYKSMTLSFPGLLAFLQINPSYEAEAETKISIPEAVTEFVVDSHFKDIPVKLSFWYRPICSQDFYSSFTLETLAGITVDGATPQSADWFLELAYSLQYLFSTLYGSPTCPQKIVLTTEADESGALWYSFDRKSFRQDFKEHELLVTVATHTDAALRQAVESWLNLSSDYIEVIHRFYGNFFFPHPKARINLVFYLQIMEFLHEILFPSANILTDQEKTQFKIIKQFIKKFLKSEKQLKQYVDNCLVHIGKPTQKIRTEKLFNELSDLYPFIFFEDATNFVKCLIETRNFYIHGTLPKRDTLLEVLEQTTAVEGLKLAILLLLLRQLNLDQGLIRRRLNTSTEFRNWNVLSNRYFDDEKLAKKVSDPARPLTNLQL
ncbi:MAG: hypothetical protein K2W82_09860 [Candidatus Obscuribacterales bacterium]|nr:hypothetical protein [Candidatus Obscuribacterales bacterium]